MFTLEIETKTKKERSVKWTAVVTETQTHTLLSPTRAERVTLLDSHPKCHISERWEVKAACPPLILQTAKRGGGAMWVVSQVETAVSPERSPILQPRAALGWAPSGTSGSLRSFSLGFSPRIAPFQQLRDQVTQQSSHLYYPSEPLNLKHVSCQVYFFKQ